MIGAKINTISDHVFITHIAVAQYRLDNSKKYFLMSDSNTLVENIYYKYERSNTKVLWYKDYRFDEMNPRSVVGEIFNPTRIMPNTLSFNRKTLLIDTPTLSFEYPQEVRLDAIADQPAILNLTYHFNSSTTLADNFSASIDVGDMFGTIFSVIANSASKGIYSKIVTMAITGVLKGALKNKWIFTLGIVQGFKYPPEVVFDNVGMTVYATLTSQYNYDYYRPWSDEPTGFEPDDSKKPLIPPVPELGEAAEYYWTSIDAPPTSFKMDLTKGGFVYSTLDPSLEDEEADREFPDWFFA